MRPLARSSLLDGLSSAGWATKSGFKYAKKMMSAVGSLLGPRQRVGEQAGVNICVRPIRRGEELRDQGHGNIVSYSRKVFIPLTIKNPVKVMFAATALLRPHRRMSRRPILASTRFSPSRMLGKLQAARKLCSRSATSRNSVILLRVARWTRWGSKRPSNISRMFAGSFCAKPVFSRTSMPA